MLQIEEIRKDFPQLGSGGQERPLIYFDNACMSLKPQAVIDALAEYYQQYPACSGRSAHRWGRQVTEKIKSSREAVARFLNAAPEEIVFVRNTTEGINFLAQSFGFQPGDLVLTTDKEHNSNLVPWLALAKKQGIRHQIVRTNPDGTFNLDNLRAQIKGARLLALVHTSNLDGVTNPAKDIIAIAHEQGVRVFLDAAQSAAHEKIDVRDLGVDYLAFSGHKILGPTGTGVFYARRELLDKLGDYQLGGNTVEMATYDDYRLLPAPERFEAGLLDYAGIIGLGEAVRYVEKIGFPDIRAQELALNQHITAEIQSLPRLRIIGPADPALRSGIVSFYVEGADMHQVAIMLDEMSGVMVRAGQHCVHSWFADRGIKNAIRASLYFYNTRAEAEQFVAGLKKIIKIF